MLRRQSLNLKKFIDSISEQLIEEYFNLKVKGGVFFLSKLFNLYRA
jgi:hypothetical protein